MGWLKIFSSNLTICWEKELSKLNQPKRWNTGRDISEGFCSDVKSKGPSDHQNLRSSESGLLINWGTSDDDSQEKE